MRVDTFSSLVLAGHSADAAAFLSIPLAASLRRLLSGQEACRLRRQARAKPRSVTIDALPRCLQDRAASPPQAVPSHAPLRPSSGITRESRRATQSPAWLSGG